MKENITNVDPGILWVTNNVYKSSVYDNLQFTSGCHTRSIVRLEPLPKEVIKASLDTFVNSVHGKNMGVPIDDSQQFLNDVNAHQIYRIIFTANGRQAYVFFTDLVEDPLQKRFLEALAESYALRENTNVDILNRIANREYGEERIRQTLKGIEGIPLRSPSMREIQREAMRLKTRCLLDAMLAAKAHAYPKQDTINAARQMSVYPYMQKNDAVLNNIAKCLGYQ